MHTEANVHSCRLVPIGEIEDNAPFQRTSYSEKARDLPGFLNSVCGLGRGKGVIGGGVKFWGMLYEKRGGFGLKTST